MSWKLLLTLFFEFFKTGLFAVGGGLATIPFLQEMMNKYHWFSTSDLMNMIAVSESTPGPISVNMATYVGYHVTGGHILGAVTTTIGLVMPSVIIICIIAKFLQKFRTNHWVNDVFSGLRPAVTGLIAATGISVLQAALMPGSGLDWIRVAVFAAAGAFVLYFKKLHPIVLISLCAVAGIVLQL